MLKLLLPAALAVLEPALPPGENPAGLSAFEWVPAELEAGAPLVVALHACEQRAADYDVETGWLPLAERLGFALLFPEQTVANNGSRCFNWFAPGVGQRGDREVRSILAFIDGMLRRHRLDANRVFLTGFSAGAAMTQLLAARDPERFAGVAPIAGVAYGCADGLATAFSCLVDPPDRTGEAWGERLRRGSDTGGPWPRVTIWQGGRDGTVAPSNADVLVLQWRHVHGLSEAAPERITWEGAVVERWGTELVERVSLSALEHRVPVSPADGCGTLASFTQGEGVCATRRIAEFFALDRAPAETPRILAPRPDRTPPDRDPKPDDAGGCKAIGPAPLPYILARRRRGRIGSRR